MAKWIKFAVIIWAGFCLCGCTIPSSARQQELYSFSREEKKIKGTFGGKSKYIQVKDFALRESYDEDIDALKEKAEKYIAGHPDLSEAAKNNLRQLRTAEGATKEEVRLLLGEPIKVKRINDTFRPATEVWIYRIQKTRAFMVFIIPVFFMHEGYYLYFKDDILTAIEKHYPEQVFKTSDAGMGLGTK